MQDYAVTVYPNLAKMVYKRQTQDKICDVPRGSNLGPNLYEDYTAAPAGSILRKHNILFHIYPDDTQVDLPFNADEETNSLHRV